VVYVAHHVRYRDMNCKNALHEPLSLSIRRRRGIPLFDFLRTLIQPRMELLGPVRRLQELQMTEDHVDRFSDDHEPSRLGHHAFPFHTAKVKHFRAN
jgi:hypothetical protein